MNVTALYFAAARHTIGKGREGLVLPTSVATIADLKKWLASRNDKYAHALGAKARIRGAVNGELVADNHRLKDGDEVALFPPASGG